MIFKIAWRNIWRNKLRSFVVITSIILGIWASIFMLSLSMGVNEARTEAQIDNFISHGQIHHPEFRKDFRIKYGINNIDKVEEVLQAHEEVLAYCKRKVVFEGMLISSKGDKGLKLIGITPQEERLVTKIHQKVTKGTYFGPIKGSPILISKRLADKNEYDINAKLIVRYQDINGDITQTKYKVVGIFETVNMMFDESSVFVLNSDISKELDLKGIFHEIAFLVNDRNEARGISKKLNDEIKDNDVEYWGKIAPDLGYGDEMMAQSLMIFMSIVMLALAFGIINTMLMAVLERKRELGMLLCIGMNKTKVFLMIMVETIFLGVIGGPIGIILAHFTISYFSKVGIDISIVSEGMSSFGMGSVIYPQLDTSYYLNIVIMVFITAIIAAIYPAFKALRLKPAIAVRAL
jgi:ABC-type lipoprotein release transport system permease subunit